MPTIERQHMVPLIDSFLGTVTGLIRDARYDGRTGARLNTLAAQIAQTCGWTRFDAGQQLQTTDLWTQALGHAKAAGNRDMVSGIVADFAYQSIWTNQPNEAVRILEGALSQQLHPAARALLHLRKARAHALLREDSTARFHMAKAETELGRTNAGTPPAWAAWMSEADLEIDGGRCLNDLGDRRAGIRRIDHGLTLLTRPRAKTFAVFQTYRAEALLDQGEQDEAARVMTGALTMATQIGATRCIDQVRTLAIRIPQSTTGDAAAELHAALRTTG